MSRKFSERNVGKSKARTIAYAKRFVMSMESILAVRDVPWVKPLTVGGL